MAEWKDVFFLLVFFSGILGCIVAAILFFLNKTDSYSSKLLAAFLVTFSLFALNFSLMTTGFFLEHPNIWRVVGFASFSYSPFAYLYVRSVLQQTYRFRKRDIILFLPALAHPFFILPYYMKPRAEKIEFLQKVIQQPELITLEEESALPGGVLFLIRILIGLLAVTGQTILLYRWYRLHKDTLHKEQQNRDTFNWLIRFTSMTVFYWILILFEIIYHRGASSQLNYSLIIVISGTILFVSLYLMVQPSLLYGIKGWNQQAPMILSENPEEAEKEVRKYALTQEQGQLIKARLEDYLSKDAPFRKLGFTIADLSHAIEIPVHQISAFINQEYAKNFNELINGYRIDYLLARQDESNDFDQYTLEALSREAGFNSRAAFITAAKKYTGKTPSELFRRRQDRK